MKVPDNLKYTSDHEWVAIDGDIATIGVTDHAQAELTDVVFLELPEIGRVVEAGEAVAVVESVKAASDIFSPVSGKVTEGNTVAEADPSLVNSDPYGDGWIFRVRIVDQGNLGELMDAAEYADLIS